MVPNSEHYREVWPGRWRRFWCHPTKGWRSEPSDPPRRRPFASGPTPLVTFTQLLRTRR